MITDAQHLDRIVVDIVRHAAALSNAWVTEDANANAPRANGGGRSSNIASDPTGSIANTAGRTRHRDHIGSTLLHVHQRLSDLVAENTPRTPTRSCRCCQREPATHGRDHKGEPVSCWACDQYLKRTKYRCDEEIHAGRPHVRMCECPSWCCEVSEGEGGRSFTSCPDRAAEGRSVSERCKKRMQRSQKVA